MNDIQTVAFIALCFVIWLTISTIVWFGKYLSNLRVLKKLTEIEQEIKCLEERLTSSEYICSIKDKGCK